VPQTISQDNIPQDEIVIDGARLRRAFRHQGRIWLWLGPLSAAVLLGLLGALVPRSYTAATSVALQQSSGGGGAIALLTGAGGGSSKRYLGILKSRSLAQTVERHVQLRQLYGAKTFRTEDDAVDFLTKSVKPDDSAVDGLLYISVTLPGPPKISPHSSPSETQVKQAAAAAANDYALALKEYYATSDIEQGSVLLRGAGKEVRLARANYEDAVNRSLDFTRNLSRVDPRSAPSLASASGTSASSGTTDAATSASGLAGLYTALNQVQAELRATQAVRAAGQALVGKQLQDLGNVPTDDPLLANARSRVTQDQSVYDTAAKLYGPENPNVVTAQTRLDVDQAELNRQIQGVKRSLTTPDIRSAEEINGLNARQAVLTRQIAQAERHLGISRNLSGEFGRLQAEVGIQLEVLKTTLSEAAKIRLDNASSLNRMTVIDAAVPPKSGEPGLTKLAAICLMLAALAFVVAVLREYSRTAPKSRVSAVPGGNGANGGGAMPADELEDAAPKAARKQSV
jgi:uncharacterized protein involved in exopolysaccharide biosynthesis